MRPFISVCSKWVVGVLLGLATAGCGAHPEMTCYGCYVAGVCISGTEATGCGAGGGDVWPAARVRNARPAGA